MTPSPQGSGSASRSAAAAKSTAALKIRNVTRGLDVATRVEVAGQSGQRRKGLLGRTGLPAGHGLWISPCEAVHTFFMKFSIDLIYLDRNLRVKKVRNSVPPWRMSACLSAHSILELAPGAALASKTMPGDKLEFSDAGF
jgi:uncharacterized membrane protein (UPF0127 family)